MQKVWWLAVALACLGGSVGAAAAPIGAAPVAERVEVPTFIQMREANLRFGFKLLSLINEAPLRANRERSPLAVERNVLLSPLGLGITLGRLLPSLPEPAQRAVASSLEWPNDGLIEPQAATALLAAQLTGADPQVQPVHAGLYWVEPGTPVKLGRDLSGNRVLESAFEGGAAPPEINRWIAAATGGQIGEALTPGPRRPGPLVVVDATVFEGIWSRAFDPQSSLQAPFTRLDGKQTTVWQMSRTGSFRYYETPGFQAVQLPFGGDGEWSMAVFVPAAGVPLRSFVRNLSDEKWRLWFEQFRMRDGSVTLPRLRLRYGQDLRRVLRALGMRPAFTRSEGEESLDAAGLLIDAVDQRTAFTVSETGITRPTAAAGSERFVLPLRPGEAPFTFSADRPFMFAVVNTYSGFVAMLGTVIDPTQP
ncbi:serpin family protein [Gloeobacter morelensis]|uniref:Serpin domain-containing protein n=1 Tax=Gloeobacter morelensis MG652769 TaxID=2781736 RepID=A0ABY3PKP8_9CYAN|nr:serpin family protein [Gloeobacter morelensis]UFP94247.1 hypothetical protein ISF26_21230 [Gloeobacter morelensis MG652769]